MTDKKVLFLGFGYVAHFAANLLRAGGFEIYGTSRDEDKIRKYNNWGYHIFDLGDANAKNYFKLANHLIISIPPKADGNVDVILEKFAQTITESVNIKSIIYLSTTGVYGDHKGAWVDENTPPKPTNQRGLLRLKAEQAWQEFSNINGINLQIFRLSGIYGPDRNMLLPLKNGTAQSVFKADQVFSRIHVQDIAKIIQASIDKYHLQGVFNLSDDYPCSTIEVNEYAARILNLPAPPIIDINDANLSQMAREFYNDCKKVKNDKLKKYLVQNLLFPTFQTGLLDCLQQERDQPDIG